MWETIRIGEVIEQLGRPAALTRFPVMEFGSGFISPVLVVTDGNRQATIQAIQEWVSTIEGRLGSLAPTLIGYVPEIVMNLVNHNHIKGGGLIIAVWPSGEADLLWCNRIDGLTDWPSEDSPEGVANSLLYRNKGGDGIGYIFRELLPRYNGVLIVNYKGSDVAFFSAEKCDIYGRNPRSSAFLPRSILFTLQLFSDETRRRSI